MYAKLTTGDDSVKFDPDYVTEQIANFRITTGTDAEIKPIDWAPGYYVCADGFVVSLHLFKREIRVKWRVLKTMRHSGGYPQVNLRVAQKSNIRRVHNLVADAFLGPKPFPKAEVRHLDGNPENNHVQNLAYGSHAENTQDMRIHGTMAIGIKNGHAVLTERDVVCIRKLSDYGIPASILSKTYGLEVGSISDIVLKRTWRHIT